MRRFIVIWLVLSGLVFPTLSHADVYTIDFDEVMTTVWTESVIWDLVAMFDVLPSDFSLDPAVSDVNGGFDISVTPIKLFPNGMLDADELALIAAILADTAFNCKASGGTTHDEVHAGWAQNYAQVYSDLGGGVGGPEALLNPSPNLIPDVEYLFAGLMTIGDKDSMAFPLELLDLVVNNETAASLIDDPYIKVANPDNYKPLFMYLAWCGDADGDGCSNMREYEYFRPQGRAQYIQAAMDPNTFPPDCTHDDRVCDGTGGLLGEYFHTEYLMDLGATRKDTMVTFDWGSGIPHEVIAADYFSVCWSGWVIPDYSEIYTFSVRTDDGVRLWVNGELLVDQWNLHGPTTYTGTTSAALTAGQHYPIKMEFYEHGGGAVAWLGWESASQAHKAIYDMNLLPGNGIGDRLNDWIYNPNNGHYYRLTASMTWQQCKDQATAWGGYLVSINDQLENDWIKELYGATDSEMYIGANDNANEGVWVWDENGDNFWNGVADGTVVPDHFANWNSGEPNNSGDTEDAGMFYRSSGLWNDLTGTQTRRGLVETDVPRINYFGPFANCNFSIEGSMWHCWVVPRNAVGEITCRWFRNGVEIPGQTTTTLTLNPVHSEDDAIFTCELHDANGAVATTGGITLTVLLAANMPAMNFWAFLAAAIAVALAGALQLRRRSGLKNR